MEKDKENPSENREREGFLEVKLIYRKKKGKWTENKEWERDKKAMSKIGEEKRQFERQ